MADSVLDTFKFLNDSIKQFDTQQKSFAAANAFKDASAKLAELQDQQRMGFIKEQEFRQQQQQLGEQLVMQLGATGADAATLGQVGAQYTINPYQAASIQNAKDMKNIAAEQNRLASADKEEIKIQDALIRANGAFQKRVKDRIDSLGSAEDGLYTLSKNPSQTEINLLKFKLVRSAQGTGLVSDRDLKQGQDPNIIRNEWNRLVTSFGGDPNRFSIGLYKQILEKVKDHQSDILEKEAVSESKRFLGIKKTADPTMVEESFKSSLPATLQERLVKQKQAASALVPMKAPQGVAIPNATDVGTTGIRKYFTQE